MNYIHRLMALLLTIAMALTLASPVYATETEPLPDVSVNSTQEETSISAVAEPQENPTSEDAPATEEPPITEVTPQEDSSEQTESDNTASTNDTPSTDDATATDDTTSMDTQTTDLPDTEDPSDQEEPLMDAEDSSTPSAQAEEEELSYAQANDLLVSEDYMETDDFGITGEQGNSYRFENGKPIDDGMQILSIQDDELLGASSTAHGIDVSKWQGSITWSKTAQDVDFAIIRCGFGTNKTANDDSKYLANVQGCQENGIPFGLYLYSYGESAASEANHVLRLLDEADLSPADLDFPIYLDMEDDCMLDKSKDTYMTNSEMLTYVTTFCDIIEDAGYEVGVYANEDWWKTYLTSSKYDQWERWLARWGAVNYNGSYNMWQYSDAGSVSGISGPVDMNYWYGSLPSSNLSSVTPKVSSFYNGATGITLKWESVSHATGYYIYRKAADGSYTKLATVKSGSTTSYTDKTPTEGTTYSYYIQAYNSSSTSAKSAIKTILRIGSPTITTENVDSGLKTTWSKVDNADYYYLYRRTTADGDWTQLKKFSASSGTLSYVDTTVTAGKSYEYCVKVQSGSYYGGRNVPVGLMKRLTTPVAKAVNGAVTSVGLNVSWNKVTGAEGYRIWRRVNSSDGWTKVGQVAGGSTLSFVDTSAVDGTTYEYTVRAYADDTESAASDAVSVKYLAPPTFSVANRDNGIQISWNATKATSYRVYSRINNSWVLLDTVSGTSYVDTSVKAGTTYRYTVRACEDSLLGCWNGSGKYMTRLTTPTVSVTNTSSGQKLSWSKVTGAAGYYVYMRTSSTGSWQKIKTITSGSTVSYTYTAAKSRTGYYYAVRAYNGSYLSTYQSTAKLVH